MPHAIEKSNGATKRGAAQKILNDAVGVTKSKDGHEKTDYTRWRLKDDRGCQTWHYLESDKDMKAWPQSTADKYFLGLDTVSWCLFQSSFVNPHRTFELIELIGTTYPEACKDSPRSCIQWSRILLPTPAPTRKLGL